MEQKINEWNSFLFREGMKAERDDPRPKAPADIFNLFRVYNIPCTSVPYTVYRT